MKLKYILLFSLTFYFVVSYFETVKAQTPPSQLWELTETSTFEPDYNSGKDWFYTMIQTSDGGYLGVGYTNMNNPSNNYGHFTPRVAKFDNNGKLLWEKDFIIAGETGNDAGHIDEVLEVSDGYIAFGPQTTYNNGDKYVLDKN